MKKSATLEIPSNSFEDRKKIIDYLIRAAAQAPSWYNCQPWKFEVNEDCIIVILDKSLDQSFYDWGNFNSLLACGAES